MFSPKGYHALVVGIANQDSIAWGCAQALHMIHRAEPLMAEGGTCLSVSFFGSTRVVRHYNTMGPVKAALESAVRYAAAELGEKGIRVHALSPGPMATRAASGIGHFDELMDAAIR